MAHRSPLEIPDDLRARLEVARLDLLALFRALDGMNLSPEEIPQRLLPAIQTVKQPSARVWATRSVSGGYGSFRSASGRAVR